MKTLPREHHIETYQATWEGITLTINWERDWSAGDDPHYRFAHLEIMADGDAILPITETGYRSEFLHPSRVDDYGGPVAYVLAWLDHDARSPKWKRQKEAHRQLSLF